MRTHLQLAAFFVVFCATLSRAQTPAAPATAATNADKADAFAEAARKGDVAAARKLLDEGVDVNTKYRYERTALSFACDRGHVDIVKLLLERGADPNAKDTFYNATPLTWASSPAMGRKPGHAEIVALLLKKGAQGKDDALASAIGASDLAMVKAILDAGGLSADALSIALEAAGRKPNQSAMVALLVNAGAKPRPEVKLDEALLARVTGTYRAANNTELVFAVTDGRLTGRNSGGGGPFTLVARNETTFGIAGAPVTFTFTIDQGKASSVAIGQGANATTYTRVEGK